MLSRNRGYLFNQNWYRHRSYLYYRKRQYNFFHSIERKIKKDIVTTRKYLNICATLMTKRTLDLTNGLVFWRRKFYNVYAAYIEPINGRNKGQGIDAANIKIRSTTNILEFCITSSVERQNRSFQEAFNTRWWLNIKKGYYIRILVQVTDICKSLRL